MLESFLWSTSELTDRRNWPCVLPLDGNMLTVGFSWLRGKNANETKSKFHVSRWLPISGTFSYMNTSFLGDHEWIVTVKEVGWFVNLLFIFIYTTMNNTVCHCMKQVDYFLYEHSRCFIHCVEINQGWVAVVTRMIKIISTTVLVQL